MVKKKVIFIVEDDPGFNLMMTNYLKSKNKWEIHSFHNGEECMGNMSLKPDLILQDFDLPGIDGLEVLKQVKARLPKCEFIFLSAQTDIKIGLEALKNGAFDYVTKDLHAKENALNKIDHAFRIHSLSDEKQEYQIVKKSFFAFLIILIVVFIVYWITGMLK